MTVTLTTKEGFEGVLYSYSNVKRCRSRGLQRTETALRFFYEEEEAAIPKNEQCGVVKEEKGIFSATVVIQNHPIIQQKGDRAIKIYCYFETGEKTISNSYNVLADTIPPGPTPPPTDVRYVLFSKYNLLDIRNIFIKNHFFTLLFFDLGTNTTTWNTHIHCQWNSSNTFGGLANY